MHAVLDQFSVRLDFTEANPAYGNLSGAALTGDWLWVANDEACGIDRLARLPPLGAEKLRFGDPVHFPLADLLDLPDGETEADLEGMAVEGDCVWVVGSHGLKRKKPKPGLDNDSNARRLAQVKLDGNRRLLARLPLQGDASGAPVPVKCAPDGRQAARLRGDARQNELMQALAEDPHFGPFLGLPGKDNGFDIEGLALLDERRLLLGLRGPVLRGWTALLEIAVECVGEELRLVPLDGSERLIRKHFIDLGGLGVRDLHLDGDALYVLAGPTMVLDGEIRLHCWSDARPRLASNTDPVAFWATPPICSSLPHGVGCDRAEAFCVLPRSQRQPSAGWLVLYDSPSATRRVGEHSVFGDLLLEASPETM